MSFIRFVYGEIQEGNVYVYFGNGLSKNTSDKALYSYFESIKDIAREEKDKKELSQIISWVNSLNKKAEIQSDIKNTDTSPSSADISEENSSDNVKLSTKDDFVNLRKSPGGEILTPIYKKDFDKIAIKKLGSEGKWLKVLYFLPSVSDENAAITGFIHNSQIAK